MAQSYQFAAIPTISATTTLSAGHVCATDGRDIYCDGTLPLSAGLGINDRIVSGSQAMMINSATGVVSLSTAGTSWGYLAPSGFSYLPYLNTLGVSATGTVSGTSGFFAGNVGIGRINSDLLLVSPTAAPYLVVGKSINLFAQSSGGDAPGGSVNIFGGSTAAGGLGGSITLLAGRNGAYLYLKGQNGPDTGGDAVLAGSSAGIGGSVTIAGGVGGYGNGGLINITAGNGTGGGQMGGSVNIRAGGGSNFSGAVNIRSGQGVGYDVSGGTINLIAGGSGPTTAGGSITLVGGTSGSGRGGDILLLPGSNQSGNLAGVGINTVIPLAALHVSGAELITSNSNVLGEVSASTFKVAMAAGVPSASLCVNTKDYGRIVQGSDNRLYLCTPR